MATLTTAANARMFEAGGNTYRRNELAQAMFKSASHRKINRAGLIVETWFDRRSKNWVTTLSNEAGEQQGDSNYSGRKEDAAIAHLWALYTILDRCSTNWPFTPKP